MNKIVLECCYKTVQRMNGDDVSTFMRHKQKGINRSVPLFFARRNGNTGGVPVFPSEKTKRPGLAKYVFFLAIMTFTIQGMGQEAHAGKGPYAELTFSIGDDIIAILQSHGMPVERNKDQPWFWISPSPEIYVVKFFKADEIPIKAKYDVLQYLMTLYDKHNKEISFGLWMYHESLQEEMRLFSGVKPYFKLFIERRTK
ncbi:MAG: hypothetical protein V2B20_28305 [Pseudomonadota bacterium]